jgi:hypothetical protein
MGDSSKLRDILYNLETNIRAKEALTDFKVLMRIKKDTNTILLVLQKIRALLFESYDVEYMKIISELIDEEPLYDAFIGIYSEYADKDDFSAVVIEVWKRDKLPFMKYMREMRKIPLMSEIVSGMEKRYSEILESMKDGTVVLK